MRAQIDLPPIAVALDCTTLETARQLATLTKPHVSTFKIGYELFLRYGHDVRHIDSLQDRKLFLDLKLHDIPRTIGAGVAALAPLEPDYLTVHAAGGAEMIKAAVDAASPQTRVAAVAVLTSLSDAQMSTLRMTGPALAASLDLSRMAVDAGARAIVCAPYEASAVREVVGADITIITPSIRPAGHAHHDQARAGTPGEALAGGADLLVLGRPVVKAEDPAEAAAAIARETQGDPCRSDV